MTNDERDLLLSVAAWAALYVKASFDCIDNRKENDRFLMDIARLNKSEWRIWDDKQCYKNLLELIKRLSADERPPVSPSPDAEDTYGWVA